MNSKLFILVFIVLGLYIVSLFTRNGDVVWLAFPFLVYLAVGLLQFPATDKVRLAAQRRIDPSGTLSGGGNGSQGEPVLAVEVTLINQGALIPSLHMVDPQPEALRLVEGKTTQRAALLHGEETVMKYSFVQKRGRYAWDSVQVWVSDPFGLAAAQVSLPAQAEHSVQPERDNFRRLPLRPNSTLHSPGSIPSRRAGSGVDFYGVRLYHPGDSLRWLDWRLTARHPGQFFTKEFEQEEVADIGLILDARQQTDLCVGEDSLFEHSVRAAASLAEGLLHQGHRLSLQVLSENNPRVFPGYGKSQLNRIMRCLSEVKTTADSSASSLEFLSLRMFSSRALLVVLSPLERRDGPFFSRLRAEGYQTLLISPDPYDFAYSTLPRDESSQQAFRLARLERRIQLEAIAQPQIQVIDWQVSQPLYPLVRTAFGHLRGQRER